MIFIKAEIGAGHITTILREAKNFAIQNNCGVVFEFNDIPMTVTPNTDLETAELTYDSLISKKDKQS